MTMHRFLFSQKALHWLLKEKKNTKEAKNSTAKYKEKKTTAVKFALSLITDEGRAFAVAAGENLPKLSPKQKEKEKKKWRRRRRRGGRRTAWMKKKTHFPLHPTVLEWRICPAGCQETASSFDFRRFAGAK